MKIELELNTADFWDKNSYNSNKTVQFKLMWFILKTDASSAAMQSNEEDSQCCVKKTRETATYIFTSCGFQDAHQNVQICKLIN